MKKPNFFIIGAPKCGTTALSTYMKSHPNVFFSPVKEPNYFNTDFSKAYRAQRGPAGLLSCEQHYLYLFSGATDKHQAVGEGTAWYLYSREALQGIRTFNPKARIIIMLRNPVELASAVHNQELYSFNERIADFSRAWRLQERRRRGLSIPRTCLEPKVLLYGDICLLGSQVERVYRIFPKQQVMVIFFEDFIARTQEIYENVLGFLGLDSDARTYFPRINENKVHRFKVLNYWLVNRPPLLLKRTVRAIQRWLGISEIGIYELIKEFNSRKGMRKPLDPMTRRTLRANFSEDIDLLGKLVGRNLEHWKE